MRKILLLSSVSTDQIPPRLLFKVLQLNWRFTTRCIWNESCDAPSEKKWQMETDDSKFGSHERGQGLRGCPRLYIFGRVEVVFGGKVPSSSSNHGIEANLQTTGSSWTLPVLNRYIIHLVDYQGIYYRIALRTCSALQLYPSYWWCSSSLWYIRHRW